MLICGPTKIHDFISHTGKGHLTGLCGNFDGEDENDFKRSTNELADNAISFASSWESQDGACDKPSEIDSCEAHPERKPWAEHGRIHFSKKPS